MPSAQMLACRVLTSFQAVASILLVIMQDKSFMVLEKAEASCPCLVWPRPQVAIPLLQAISDK